MLVLGVLFSESCTTMLGMCDLRDAPRVDGADTARETGVRALLLRVCVVCGLDSPCDFNTSG